MMLKKKLYDLLYNLKGKKIYHTNWWQTTQKDFLSMALPRCILTLDGILSPIPKVDVTSVFGDRIKIENSKADVKIFFTGEDCTVRYPQYKDYMLDTVDLSLGFDYEEDRQSNPRYMHYPMAWIQFFPITTDKDILRNHVNWINTRPNSKENFCALVASHDNQGTRKILYDLISPLGEIKCGGRIFHNDDSLKQDFNDNKIEYLSHFMFNLCPENVSVKGYVTEKIYEAFCAGSIPIYYGGGGYKIEPDIINQERILVYDGQNMNDLYEHIKELMSNEKCYKNFLETPPLSDTAVDYLSERNAKLIDKLREILHKKR